MWSCILVDYLSKRKMHLEGQTHKQDQISMNQFYEILSHKFNSISSNFFASIEHLFTIFNAKN